MKKRKDPTQKTETIPGGIIRTEGRIGTPTHYVEFDPQTVSRVKYVAQRGKADGSIYFVFEVYPGKKGKCKTMAHGDFFTACKYAQRAAGGTLPEFHQ